MSRVNPITPSLKVFIFMNIVGVTLSNWCDVKGRNVHLPVN